MYLNLKAPISVQLEVTYECNKNCIHCYNYWRTEGSKISNKASVNHEILGKIVDGIIESEVFRVVITGGEPLLVFDQIYPYLEKLHHNRVKLAMNSNLMLLNQEIIEKMKKLILMEF